MTLVDWAAKWGVSLDALRDLATSISYTPPTTDDGSESRQQSLVRLEAAQKRNVYLFRNNVGAGILAESGSFVRWGLANDSEAMNNAVKSGDLVGFRSKLIVSADVGTVVAQFVSREVKHATWKWQGTPKELAQLKWAAIINTHGGDAAIVTGPGSL